MLPDIGVDLEALLLAVHAAVGAAVVVAVGGYFAFLVVKKGMSWARSAVEPRVKGSNDWTQQLSSEEIDDLWENSEPVEKW